MLEIRVLGGLEVIRDGVPAMLPPSRKTRALLGYLALTRCRTVASSCANCSGTCRTTRAGRLRWSLSKIRPLVDEPAFPRLLADRQSVELRCEALDIDFFSAQVCAGR